MNKPEYIIGIDLSLSSTGLCVLCPRTKDIVIDVIQTNSKQDFADRCFTLYKGLVDFYQDYEHLNPYIAVELPQGSQSSKASKASGACTAAFCATPMWQLPKKIYGPRDIKLLVGHPKVKGYGRKRLNIDLVQELYPDAPLSRDKNGAILRKENDKCDAILLAELAYRDYK